MPNGLRALFITLASTMIFAVTNGSGAAVPNFSKVSENTQENTGETWTAARMASAAPVDALRARTDGSHSIPPRESSTTSPPAGTLAGTYTAGIPAVGRLFMLDISGNAMFCSASVVHSAAKDVISTAAHCKQGVSAIFVPMYKSGADMAHQPFGAFTVTHWTIDPRYYQNTAQASNFDEAFATVATGAKGQLENAVHGGLTLTAAPSATNHVLASGYPGSWVRNGILQDPQGAPVQCAVDTKPLPGYRQMQMTCDYFHDGVSGGPWIANYNSTTHLGDLIGVTGGLGGGGNSADDDWVSYSPIFDQNTINLFNSTAPTALPPVGLHTPGKAWANARLTASGRFAGTTSSFSDLLVVWKNGEVDAYPNLGNEQFGGEIRLANSGSAFTRAISITAAGFTSTASDLVVNFGDGTLTLYRSVSPSSRLSHQVQLAAKGSVFKYARAIAAGAFVGTGNANDLIVQWVDGQVSQYVDCGLHLGQERQVAAEGSSWKYAHSLSAGLFPGTGWGIMTEWLDGQVTIDSNIGPGAHLTETTLVPKHDATWSRYFRTLTVGRYTSPAQADDALVTWSDGEVDLYPATSTHGLGSEHRLIQGQ